MAIGPEDDNATPTESKPPLRGLSTVEPSAGVTGPFDRGAGLGHCYHIWQHNSSIQLFACVTSTHAPTGILSLGCPSGVLVITPLRALGSSPGARESAAIEISNGAQQKGVASACMFIHEDKIRNPRPVAVPTAALANNRMSERWDFKETRQGKGGLGDGLVVDERME
ncbi:hypothetical protein MMC29_002690 [Sticta canariensis]|nr:hypothetical protein [Sticta canariensis]